MARADSGDLKRAFTRLFGLPFALVERTYKPFAVLLFVFVFGTLGYWVLGHVENRNWTLLDCAYQTSITLTTVGFGDELRAGATDLGKIYTMFLIVTGMGATVYSVSALTAFIVEGYLGALFKEARLDRAIEKLSGHTIICGVGAVGRHVVAEHRETGHPFVIIERDQEKLDNLLEDDPDLLYIRGDATQEEELERAGLRRAQGLVASLASDKDNLFLVVTARYMAKDLPIVSKCLEHDSLGKFQAAGATHVVSPTFIGGMRIASQILRPHVVDFLDTMLRSAGNARVSEVTIAPESTLAGKTIVTSRIGEKVGLLIVAMKPPGASEFVYSPKSDTVLDAGAVIVVIGPRERVTVLEQMATRPSQSGPTRRALSS